MKLLLWSTHVHMHDGCRALDQNILGKQNNGQVQTKYENKQIKAIKINERQTKLQTNLALRYFLNTLENRLDPTLSFFTERIEITSKY